MGLGAQIEGDAADTLEALPTDTIGIGPYLCIVDEYAAIVTPGFEVVLTQGRGLGIAAIVASQDYAGIFKADEKGAQQMVANTSIKAFMKLQDAEKTWELIRGQAGQSTVVRSSGFTVNDKSGSTYADTMREDPEHSLLESLELEYDKGLSKDLARRQGRAARPASARKAAIFRQRVLKPTQIVDRADTAKDALVISLRETGKVDFARMFQRLDNFLEKGLEQAHQTYQTNVRQEMAELDTVKAALGQEFPQQGELALVRENHGAVMVTPPGYGVARPGHGQ